MDISRRHLLNVAGATAGAAAITAEPARAAPLTATLGRDVTYYGVRSDSSSNQTVALQRAIDEAARDRIPLALPPGDYRTGALKLPNGVQLTGVRGATRLRFSGGAQRCQSVNSYSSSGILPIQRPNRVVSGQAGRFMREDEQSAIMLRTGGARGGPYRKWQPDAPPLRG